MPCNQSNYPRFNNPLTLVNASPGAPAWHAVPCLFASDSPELIPNLSQLYYSGGGNETLTNTLAKASIPLIAGSAEPIRVFVWHLNKGTSNITIQLIASTASNTGAIVSSFRKEVQTGSNLAAIGFCLAKVQLFQSFGSPTPVTGTLSQTERLLWSQTIAPSELVGALIEFTVTSAQATTAQLRTAANSSSSLAGGWSDPCADENVPWDYSKDPAPFQEVHNRGWFTYSQFVMTCGNFDVNSDLTGPLFKEVSLIMKDGPEQGSNGFGVEAVLGPCKGEKGNKGCFGANLYYEVTLTNSNSSRAQQGFVALMARNVGSAFFGAARIVAPTGYPEKGVASIVFSDPNADPPDGKTNYAVLTVDAQGYPYPISVPASGQVTVRVAVAIGGAATAPVQLLFSRRSFSAIPPGSGGTS